MATFSTLEMAAASATTAGTAEMNREPMLREDGRYNVVAKVDSEGIGVYTSHNTILYFKKENIPDEIKAGIAFSGAGETPRIGGFYFFPLTKDCLNNLSGVHVNVIQHSRS